MPGEDIRARANRIPNSARLGRESAPIPRDLQLCARVWGLSRPAPKAGATLTGPKPWQKTTPYLIWGNGSSCNGRNKNPSADERFRLTQTGRLIEGAETGRKRGVLFAFSARGFESGLRKV